MSLGHPETVGFRGVGSSKTSESLYSLALPANHNTASVFWVELTIGDRRHTAGNRDQLGDTYPTNRVATNKTGASQHQVARIKSTKRVYSHQTQNDIVPLRASFHQVKNDEIIRELFFRYRSWTNPNPAWPKIIGVIGVECSIFVAFSCPMVTKPISLVPQSFFPLQLSRRPDKSLRHRTYPTQFSSVAKDLPLQTPTRVDYLENEIPTIDRTCPSSLREAWSEHVSLGLGTIYVRVFWDDSWPDSPYWESVWQAEQSDNLVQRLCNLLRFLIFLWARLLASRTFHRDFSVFPGKRRPPCTTMPWTIWPALVVLWGVCWMFYTPSSPDDSHLGLSFLFEDGRSTIFPDLGEWSERFIFTSRAADSPQANVGNGQSEPFFRDDLAPSFPPNHLIEVSSQHNAP